ncbi:MAG: hypothetical protein A2808_02520 [Candidatus Moranbacteria bacterium RIFCSPHIGHO2_01_FULL_55_24]|nr:MAG: hypothetical protein A2808_02520 [Candidatus Moranbacteria bacterium RIFCSPHIGHO2_01_FULL_55_24]
MLLHDTEGILDTYNSPEFFHTPAPSSRIPVLKSIWLPAGRFMGNKQTKEALKKKGVRAVTLAEELLSRSPIDAVLEKRASETEIVIVEGVPLGFSRAAPVGELCESALGHRFSQCSMGEVRDLCLQYETDRDEWLTIVTAGPVGFLIFSFGKVNGNPWLYVRKVSHRHACDPAAHFVFERMA